MKSVILQQKILLKSVVFELEKLLKSVNYNAVQEDYKNYPLPKFYKFKSKEERERILYKNFVQVGEDVKAMIKEIQQFRTMM